MSKWRPTPGAIGAIYVIPDIHGHLEQLELICKRILPLRKSDGGKDKLVFLGDYIDRGPDNYGVIEFLISLKKDYGDQIVFLRGNHEDLLLTALDRSGHDSSVFECSAYSMWIQNGGATTLKQYAEKKLGHSIDPYEFSKSRLSDVIPESHINFLLETEYYHEHEDYIFVHGGCDPNKPLSEQNKIHMMWDRSLFQVVKKFVLSKTDLPWSKTVITGHNYHGPFINEKFMMLDCSVDKKLIIIELNSMEGFEAKLNKKRLVKCSFKETIISKRPAFRKIND
jgi:serine/threonine protein phosphatase 1